MAADGHAVVVACGVLAVSESGFYAQRHRAPSARAIRHAALTELIGHIHLDSHSTYEARRVHAELTLGHGLSVAVRWSR
jgi:putative transposase